jgi:hypothetical protein
MTLYASGQFTMTSRAADGRYRLGIDRGRRTDRRRAKALTTKALRTKRRGNGLDA